MVKNKKACDACHRRKIQCDISSKPGQCNWCDHHGLSCTFNRVRGRRNKTPSKFKQGSRDDIALRLARVEEVLSRNGSAQDLTQTVSEASFIPTPGSTTSALEPTSLGEQLSAYEPDQPLFVSSPGAGGAIGVSPGQIHFDGYHLGQISTQNGIPVFSDYGQKWIASRTGEDSSFRKLGVMNPSQRKHPSTVFSSHSLTHCVQPCDLPDRDQVEQFLQIFQRSGARLVFPVIDAALFQRTMRIAYEQGEGPPSLEQISARACILAFCAIIPLYQLDGSKTSPVDCDACGLKAKSMLPDIIQDASLTSLQTSMHESFSGRFQPATMFHSMACRIVFQLGGQNYVSNQSEAHEDPHDLNIRAKRHLRMLFWLCYMFDKNIVLRTVGQPPCIPDEHCDLTLPDNYVEKCYDPASYPEDRCSSLWEDRLLPTLPGDIRLGILKSKTCKLLYSAEATRKSEADLLRDIRELDDELENWRLSIPPAFRPSLSIRAQKKATFGSNLHLSMMHIFLRLEYHYLMSAIHRASGRCRMTESELQGTDIRGALQSSAELSVEAARSTIIYLHSAVHALAANAFWVVIFYPISAIVSLFCHILANPLDAQTQEDLALLSSANHVVNSLPMRKLSAQEMVHIKMINEFVLELIRLAKCAISQAQVAEDER